MDAEQVASTVSLLRSQRHSFMNHLQVISGWLQLGRTERAYQYLVGLASAMAAESDALRQAPPGVQLAIIALGLEAEPFGVRIDWRLEAPVTDLTDNARLALHAQVMAGVQATAALPEGERWLEVRLGPETALVVHTPLSPGEG